MGELENIQEVVEQEEVVAEPEKAVELSPVEERALAEGWVSLEEWTERGNDPEEWVDAKTFNIRGELFDKIHGYKREVQELKSVVDNLKQLNTQVAKKEREKLVKDLKKAKVQALENDDHESVVDIDEELAKLREAPEEGNVQDPSQIPEEFSKLFDKWKRVNTWYDSDEDLQLYADSYGQRIAQAANGSMSYDEILEKVSKRVREVFPNKFTNPNRAVQTVATSSRTSKGTQAKAKHSVSDLSEDQLRVAKRFERNGVMSVDDYIKQLEDIGEL